jgi:branched-chain amino acid transport system permease protein
MSAESPVPPAAPETVAAAAPALRGVSARRSTILDGPLWALGAILALAAPLLLPSAYWLRILILICIFAIVNQAWNLILGYAGIWSFAQLALFVLGGYTAALISLNLGWSPWVGTLAGAGTAVLASLVVGIPSLRLKGAYVFLLTLAFHEIFRNLFILDTDQRFGGQYGLQRFAKWDFGGETSVERLTRTYYVALLLLVLTAVAIRAILRSPMGLAFRALRDSEAYALSRGVPEYRFKLLVYAISAAFTGFAGGFYAHYIGSISPTNLDFGILMNQMAMIVIGGWGTFFGPILGTALVTLLNEQLRDVDQWRPVIFGAALVATVVFLPRGLVQPLSALRDRAAAWLERRVGTGRPR